MQLCKQSAKDEIARLKAKLSKDSEDYLSIFLLFLKGMNNDLEISILSSNEIKR